MAKEAYYAMKTNTAKKTVDLVVSGTFTPEKVQRFVNDYQKEVGKVNPKDYSLVLDCTDLDVVTQDMIPDLEACYRMYKDSGFNKVIFEIQDKPIVKMQLSRIARTSGLTNAEVVVAQR